MDRESDGSTAALGGGNGSGDERGLAKRAVVAFLLGSLVRAGSLIGLIAFVDLAWLPRVRFPLDPPILTLALGGWLLLQALLHPPLLHRSWRFRVRAGDVLARYGVLWRSERAVPLHRIQHADVESGPIDRLFGLATLRLYTAGSSLADLEIPGLDRADARSLRDSLLAPTPTNCPAGTTPTTESTADPSPQASATPETAP